MEGAYDPALGGIIMAEKQLQLPFIAAYLPDEEFIIGEVARSRLGSGAVMHQVVSIDWLPGMPGFGLLQVGFQDASEGKTFRRLQVSPASIVIECGEPVEVAVPMPIAVAKQSLVLPGQG